MLFELTLVRIFSFSIWHHFAFMVISIALLGFAASGAIARVRPGLTRPTLPRAASFSSVFGVTAVLAVALVTHLPLDPANVVHDPTQIVVIAVYYLTLAVPFTFAGLAVVTLLAGFSSSAGTLYAADLAGAAMGALALAPILGAAGGEGTVLVVACIASLSAAMLALPAGGAREAVPWLVLAVLAAGVVPFAADVLVIPPGPAKALGVLMDHARFPDTRVVFTRWDALSRVDVVDGAPPVSWSRNPHAPVASPAQTQIVIDGDAATPIVSSSRSLAGLGSLDYTLSSAAPQTFHPARALVIGSGGGIDVLTALHHGARRVDAVEVNPIILGLVRGPYARRSGYLFSRPDVFAHEAEGRSFVRRSGARFDLIQLSLIDTWASAGAGAYSLAESYLYTVEAIADELAHLSPHGTLSITRWLHTPPRETLKLCAVIVEALRRRGVREPSSHIVVLSLGQLANVLVRAEPFTDGELRALGRTAEARGFRFAWARGVPGRGDFARLLGAQDERAFLDAYPYDIHPATDDSPFFFQFGRWRDANPLGSGWSPARVELSGRPMLLVVLVQALVLSLLLLVFQRLARPRTNETKANTSSAAVGVYFFLIGLAFMLLEVTLMQRFTLFLGHPIYAITVVLASLLLAAGGGSALAARLTQKTTTTTFVFAAIVVISVAAALGLPLAFRAALGLPLAARVALAMALLAPLGLLLGIPFPAAIRRLGARGDESLVGWAWAANGCASVIGPIVAVLLAIDLGFGAVTYVAAAGYAGAWLALRRI